MLISSRWHFGGGMGSSCERDRCKTPLEYILDIYAGVHIARNIITAISSQVTSTKR